MRTTDGRWPSSGVPLTRIIAVSMLATLISTVFTLPANAGVLPDLSVAVTPAPATAPSGTNVTYTITVTNTDTTTDSVSANLTDDVGNGTYVSNDQGCTFAAPTLTCTVPAITATSTWVVNVTVTAPLSTAGAFVNTATVAMTGDTVAANNVAITTVPVTALADVTIAKSHAGALTPGTDVTYTLVVSNAGPDAATSVSVTDTLSASLAFKSSASSCTAVGQAVTCPVLDVPAASTRTVTFVATIGAPVAIGTVITNTATVSTVTPESNFSNNTSNTDSLTVGSGPVDLTVGLTVLPTTAAPGDTVTYTVTVTNPDIITDATNVVVTDVLPAGVTAVTPPTTGPAGTTTAVSANTWTWTIPTLVKATSSTTPTVVTAAFDAVVDPTTTLTTITNTVSVLGTEFDPDVTNNTASVDLTIVALVSDLDITTAVDDSEPDQGDTIAIGIRVTNHGPDEATNVVFKDVLPTGLKFKSCTGCSGRDGRRAWSQMFTVASIPVDSAVTIILNVTVQASDGTLKNTASVVSSDQSDPDGTNDKDSLNIIVGGTNGSGSGSTVGQLTPWFMLLFTLGLIALEWARRMRPVTPIGSTYGFDVPF